MTNTVRPSISWSIPFSMRGFGTGINGGGGLIQDQHRRIRHGGPGNGQKLALALGEIGAVAGDHGVVAFGKPADKGIRIGDRAAFSISSWVASSFPKRILSAMVP